jgi:hypothetical protein
MLALPAVQASTEPVVMDVYFCDQCSIRVSDADLRRGHGIKKGDIVVCGRCIELGLGQDLLAQAQIQEPVAAVAAPALAGANVLDAPRDRAATAWADDEPLSDDEAKLAGSETIRDDVPESDSTTSQPAIDPNRDPAIGTDDLLPHDEGPSEPLSDAFVNAPPMLQEETADLPRSSSSGPKRTTSSLSVAAGGFAALGGANNGPAEADADAEDLEEVSGVGAILDEDDLAAGSDSSEDLIPDGPPPTDEEIEVLAGDEVIDGRGRSHPSSELEIDTGDVFADAPAAEAEAEDRFPSGPLEEPEELLDDDEAPRFSTEADDMLAEEAGVDAGAEFDDPAGDFGGELQGGVETMEIPEVDGAGSDDGAIALADDGSLSGGASSKRRSKGRGRASGASKRTDRGSTRVNNAKASRTSSGRQSTRTTHKGKSGRRPAAQNKNQTVIIGSLVSVGAIILLFTVLAASGVIGGGGGGGAAGASGKDLAAQIKSTKTVVVSALRSKNKPELLQAREAIRKMQDAYARFEADPAYASWTEDQRGNYLRSQGYFDVQAMIRNVNDELAKLP